MLSRIRDRLDGDLRVRVRVSQSDRDGRWRWSASADGQHQCVGPIKGFATHDEAREHADSLLNVRG